MWIFSANTLSPDHLTHPLRVLRVPPLQPDLASTSVSRGPSVLHLSPEGVTATINSKCLKKTPNKPSNPSFYLFIQHPASPPPCAPPHPLPLHPPRIPSPLHPPRIPPPAPPVPSTQAHPSRVHILFYRILRSWLQRLSAFLEFSAAFSHITPLPGPPCLPWLVPIGAGGAAPKPQHHSVLIPAGSPSVPPDVITSPFCSSSCPPPPRWLMVYSSPPVDFKVVSPGVCH